MVTNMKRSLRVIHTMIWLILLSFTGCFHAVIDETEEYPKLENGAPCSKDLQCLSGFCPELDGVCCDSRCDGKCEACKQERQADGMEKTGECRPIWEQLEPDC